MRAVVDEVVDRLDLASARSARRAPDGLALNDIGRVRLRVSRPLPVEPYAANRVTGAFVLIDEGDERHRRRGHGRELGVSEADASTSARLARGGAATAALAWSERITQARASSGALPNSMWRRISQLEARVLVHLDVPGLVEQRPHARPVAVVESR